MINWAVFNEAEDSICIDFDRKWEADEWLAKKHAEGLYTEYHVAKWEYESREERIVRVIKDGLKSEHSAYNALIELADMHGVDAPTTKNGSN